MTESIVAEGPVSCQDMHGLLLEILEVQQAQRQELRVIQYYLGLPGSVEDVVQHARRRVDRVGCNKRNIAAWERITGGSGRKEDA